MGDEPNGDDLPGADREADEESPPLQNLVDEIRGGDVGSGMPGGGDAPPLEEGSTDFFDERSSEPLDAEAVWRSLESDRPNAADETESREADTEHVVPKRWYCEQCEHFSEPPEVRCTYPDSVILEFVGTENVRVRNCPVVAERKALGQFETE